MDTKEMDIIELARELGRKMQTEESYIKYQMAKQNADEDEELQNLIGEFNLKRLAVSNESAKEEDERDPEKVRTLNQEMRKAYGQIMSNEKMIAFNDAKDSFDVLMKRISAILQQSSEGENPDTADYTPSCSGSCATCGGCH